jgi:hypothetical protein
VLVSAARTRVAEEAVAPRSARAEEATKSQSVEAAAPPPGAAVAAARRRAQQEEAAARRRARPEAFAAWGRAREQAVAPTHDATAATREPPKQSGVRMTLAGEAEALPKGVADAEEQTRRAPSRSTEVQWTGRMSPRARRPSCCRC